MGDPDGQPLSVVLHPRHPRGVAEAFRASKTIHLVEPEESGVVDALDDVAILVTYVWRPDYLRPHLRWVQSVSAGVDQFPLDDLRAADVALTSASGVHGPQVAEHTFALLLSLTRAVGVSIRDAGDHIWRPRTGAEIAGLTMAILGLGTIGEEIARRAVAWDMRVIGTKADPGSYAGVAERVMPPSRTVDVCREADVVVCVLPDNESTRGIIGADALDALGDGWLINVGRGTAVDEDALIDALDRGRLRGAGLDVFATEPLRDDSPLWSHPRVVLTPHIAGLSPKYGERLVQVFERNLPAFGGGRPWTGRVV